MLTVTMNSSLRAGLVVLLIVPFVMPARAEAQTIPDGYGVLAPERAFLGSDAQSPPGNRQPARDSVLNGVLIGAGAGALLGLIPDYYDDCGECHDSLYASIAVGAAVGLIVDLLRTRPAAAAATPPGKSVQVGPALGRGAIGVRGRVRWK